MISRFITVLVSMFIVIVGVRLSVLAMDAVLSPSENSEFIGLVFFLSGCWSLIWTIEPKDFYKKKFKGQFLVFLSIFCLICVLESYLSALVLLHFKPIWIITGFIFLTLGVNLAINRPIKWLWARA